MRASAAANTTSHARTSSNPPAIAVPLTAATTGSREVSSLRKVRPARRTKSRISPCRPSSRSRSCPRSAPAQKAAPPRDHHGADALVRLRLLDGLLEEVQESVGECVEPLRPVETDQRDRVDDLQLDQVPTSLDRLTAATRRTGRDGGATRTGLRVLHPVLGQACAKRA